MSKTVDNTFIKKPYHPVVLRVMASKNASTTIIITAAMGPNRKPPTPMTASITSRLKYPSTLGMIVFNYIVTPLYFKMPRAGMVDMMPMIAVFNLVKGTLNAALLMMIYPPVSTALRKVGLVAPSVHRDGEKRKFSYLPLVGSLIVLAVAVVMVLKLLKVI